MTKNRAELKEKLLKELDFDNIPAHIGIIMDGNGRWAKSKGKTRIHGHQEGARRVKSVVRFADDIGVKHISLYAFSVENWARPSFEVSALMRLIKAYIVREREELHSEGVRFRMIGRRSDLAPEIIKEAEISTRLMENNPGLSLNLCINYGGRAEVVDAVKEIVVKGIPAEDIYRRTYTETPLSTRSSRRGSGRENQWRNAYQQLPFMARCLCRVIFHSNSLARV